MLCPRTDNCVDNKQGDPPQCNINPFALIRIPEQLVHNYNMLCTGPNQCGWDQEPVKCRTDGRNYFKRGGKERIVKTGTHNQYQIHGSLQYYIKYIHMPQVHLQAQMTYSTKESSAIVRTHTQRPQLANDRNARLCSQPSQAEHSNSTRHVGKIAATTNTP